ncbi:MAG: DUF1552 domain-containing protein [Planctomycetes bacterium]|nr:DUF1552 domain-containing protein [Planctomycetota bacterium]
MTSHWQISRRTMLQGTGAALALPFLDVMNPAASAAVKNAARPPQRLVCLFQPNGVFPPAWDCSGTGADFELSPILQPLQSLKKDILVLSNIDNCNGRGHVVATGGFLTGVAMRNRKNAVSLDQFVAQNIGGQTALPSLELGTEPPRQGGNRGLPISFANTVSWSSPTTRVSPEINPQVAFDRLFRAGKASKRNAEDARSIIDLVLEDAKNLRGKVSSADRHKLDEYLSGVRSVEKRIDSTLNPPKRSWTPKTQPQLVRPAGGIPDSRDKHVRLMMDLTILALQTDTTRVSTLMLAHGFSRQNFTFIGVKGDHHTISHHKNQKRWTDDYVKVSRWYISQFAYLLERMKSIDEGGTSLLQNSILLYGSGLKDGNGHKTKNLPLLLAGHGGGTLKPGRHVVCKKGTPIANLHLSLAQRMGVKTERFNTSTGTIAGLS